MTTPETKYAKSGDVHIAYQTVGKGSPDLVLVPGWVSHVEYAWEEPSFSYFLRRLAAFSRLILIDRRGTGLSDRVTDLPILEQRMDDVRAVMDAAGSERATLFGISEAGPMCLLFAATYPGRTAALIVYGTFARALRAPDYPIGLPAETLGKFLEWAEEPWGTGAASADYFAPSRADDEAFRRSSARFERLAVSPAGIGPLRRSDNVCEHHGRQNAVGLGPLANARDELLDLVDNGVRVADPGEMVDAGKLHVLRPRDSFGDVSRALDPSDSIPLPVRRAAHPAADSRRPTVAGPARTPPRGSARAARAVPWT